MYVRERSRLVSIYAPQGRLHLLPVIRVFVRGNVRYICYRHDRDLKMNTQGATGADGAVRVAPAGAGPNGGWTTGAKVA